MDYTILFTHEDGSHNAVGLFATEAVADNYIQHVLIPDYEKEGQSFSGPFDDGYYCSEFRMTIIPIKSKYGAIYK